MSKLEIKKKQNKDIKLNLVLILNWGSFDNEGDLVGHTKVSVDNLYKIIFTKKY